MLNEEGGRQKSDMQFYAKRYPHATSELPFKCKMNARMKK